MKSGRSRLTLVLALMLATASALAAFAYLNARQQSDAAAPPVAPTVVPRVAVLVATQNIPVNTLVTRDMFEVREVPADQKLSHALSSPEDVIGKVTTAAIVTGEQIVESRVSSQPPQPETFAINVPVGKRAIAVQYDEVIGSGALIQPGDRVDVIGFFKVELQAPKQEKGTDTKTQTPAFTVSAGPAKLLAQPDKDARVVTELEQGTELTILGAQGRYFRVQTADGETGWLDAEVIAVNPEAQGSGVPGTFEKIAESKVALYVVQNVEVLAVAQALSPEDPGIEQRDSGRTQAPSNPAGDPASTATAAEQQSKPVARPQAKSATLAVTPEEAQRLLLALQTADGIRLALRAPGDTTIASLAPAEVGPLPIGDALSGIRFAQFPSELVITDVEFSQRVVNAGQMIEFKATVKNVSNRTIVSSKAAPPEFTYTEGTAYDTLGFFPETGTYRIGLNVSGAFPTQFPYRWSLGRDLKPGESITVAGSVQLTNPTPATRYWLGVILEPDMVTQDGVGVADVTVLVPNAATVEQAQAQLRSDPSPDAALIETLPQGQELVVKEVRDGWFRVQAGQKEGWIDIGAVRVAPPQATEQSSATQSASDGNGFDWSWLTGGSARRQTNEPAGDKGSRR